MLQKTKIAALLTTLLLAGCGSEATGIITPVLPYNPVDEGWKVLANYEYAYNTRDEELLSTTLDTQFLHHLLPEDWDDYNGDGTIDSTWNYEYEMYSAQILFSRCEVIEFLLDGESSSQWYGDPSGESINYLRAYQMKAYSSYPDSVLITTGDYSLICKPDTNDIWHLTHLINL